MGPGKLIKMVSQQPAYLLKESQLLGSTGIALGQDDANDWTRVAGKAVASGAYSVDRVCGKLHRSGTGCDVVAKLYTNDATQNPDEPNTTVLATSSTVLGTSISTSLGQVCFDFPTPHTVALNDEYWVSIEGTCALSANYTGAYYDSAATGVTDSYADYGNTAVWNGRNAYKLIYWVYTLNN